MKVALITGISSGIGYDLANYLVSKDFIVYGLSRRQVEIKGVKSICCDIKNIQQIRDAFKFISEEVNHLDVLINNAGMGIAGSILDSDYEDIENIFDTNVFGTIRICKEFMPLLQLKAKIINIGSVAGDFSIPYQGFYSMSKSSIDKLGECLNIELKNRKIRVTTILPGDTKTSFTENRRIVIKDQTTSEVVSKSINRMAKDEQNGASPRKVSKVIYRVIKRKRPPVRVAVGFSYKLLLFLQRLLPRFLVIKIIGMIYAKN